MKHKKQVYKARIISEDRIISINKYNNYAKELGTSNKHEYDDLEIYVPIMTGFNYITLTSDKNNCRSTLIDVNQINTMSLPAKRCM